MRRSQLSFLALYCIITLQSCSDPVEKGNQSLVGSWTIAKATELENQPTNSGNLNVSQIENNNPEGEFIFSKDSVKYSYTLPKGVVSSSDSYILHRERVNSGFTKVNLFTIDLGDKSFALEFGDQTTKSYKDATKIRLTESIESDGIEQVVILELIKN